MKVVVDDWILKAEKLMDSTTEWNDQFYPRDNVKGHLYWIKSKLSAWDGKFSDATQYVDKLKAIEDSPHYKRKKEEIDAALVEWSDNSLPASRYVVSQE